jgi:hypothetical protein
MAACFPQSQPAVAAISTTSAQVVGNSNSNASIYVMAAVVTLTVAGTATFTAGSGGATLLEVATGADGTVVLPYNPDGWFRVPAGTALNVIGTGTSQAGSALVDFVIR